MGPLREAQLLRAIAPYTERTGWRERETLAVGATQGEMATLVRWGFVRSATQSEQVRGERRVYWRLYQITHAGLRRLEVLG